MNINIAGLSDDDFDSDEPPHLNGNDISRRLLPELIVDEADPTAAAKELTAMFVGRSGFLFNGSHLFRVIIDPNGSPRAIAVTDNAVRIMAHEICTPVKLRRTKKGERLIPCSISKDIAQIYLNGLQDRWNLPKLHRYLRTTMAPCASPRAMTGQAVCGATMFLSSIFQSGPPKQSCARPASAFLGPFRLPTAFRCAKVDLGYILRSN
jgi:hypothetical protein